MIICETTDQAEDAVPNGTVIQHVKGRIGKITGSQRVDGRLWYHSLGRRTDDAMDYGRDQIHSRSPKLVGAV